MLNVKQWERLAADAGAEASELVTVEGASGADSIAGLIAQPLYDSGKPGVTTGTRALIYAVLRALQAPAVWTPLVLVPGWITGFDGRPPASWRFLPDGSVALRGRITGSALGPVALLPQEMRPQQDRVFVVAASGGALTARVSVLAAGMLYLEAFGTGASSWIDLDSVRFDLG